jgi:hypothetical protein
MKEIKFEIDILTLHLCALSGFSWFRTGIKDSLFVNGIEYSLRELVGLYVSFIVMRTRLSII